MIKNFVFTLLAVIACLSPISQVFAEEPNPVKIEIFVEDETIQPNHPFWVALHFDIEKGWHSYWKNPGDSGVPPNIEWKLPPGYEVKSLEWPVPEKFTIDSMVGYGYQGDFYLLAQINPTDSMQPDSIAEIKAKIKWLVCNDSTCLPGTSKADLALLVKDEKPKVKERSIPIFGKARASLPSQLPNTKANLNKDSLHLNLDLPQPPASENLSVHFFPSRQEVIDPSIEPTLNKSDSSANTWTVTFKAVDPNGSVPDNLEGVVVIANEKGERLHAFDITAPIDNQNDEIAVLDTANPKAVDTIIMAPAQSSEFEGGVTWAVVLAFAGGILLNLMPCVLPVMSFKILSFVKMAGQDRWLTLKHGLMFALGVLVSFWILAGAMLGLQAYGSAVGWGFQLQDPLFVAVLAAFLFIFSLSLFGIFELGTFFASWAGQTQSDAAEHTSGFTGSFFSGVLATAIATPCTGPFLGSAIGFAVTLPAIWAMVIFTSLGIGMALPYVALSAFPKLLNFMPKPGAWMVSFKEIVAFLVLATVLWLLWVFGAETNTQAMTIMLAALLSFAFGCWVYGRWGAPFKKRPVRIASYAVAFLCFAGGIYGVAKATSSDIVRLEDNSSHEQLADEWEPFSRERVEELRRQGKPVLIDFTAKWCLICQANHIVLSADQTNQKLKDAGVVKMKADWTKSDPVITEELKKFGRNSVPLYVLYGPKSDEQPTILPQVLTPEIVAENVDKLGETAIR